jgi:2-C-methyl-D-erythritol 2,4-cyclodiphosphate synthase
MAKRGMTGYHRDLVRVLEIGSSESGLPMRVGIGHDTHRLVDGRPLILGGVRIDHPRGLFGHSDADVVLHAVADALLGAAALGDIGEHFPDTDPRWQGLDSGHLLSEVVETVARAGWKVGNCDVVIHAQEPKLMTHKLTIRENLAELLGVDRSAVNVKAKTGEHVGPIGRGEAIACEAIVLLLPREDAGLRTQD